MKVDRFLALLILVCCLGFSPLHAQYVKTSGKIIQDGNGDTLLIRSMGVGGWMVQEGYMLQTASFASPQHKIRDTIEVL